MPQQQNSVSISQLENHQPGPGPGNMTAPAATTTYVVYSMQPQAAAAVQLVDNKGSPPPYDQALLQQQHQQPHLTLQKQVQAASEVVHTLSQMSGGAATVAAVPSQPAVTVTSVATTSPGGTFQTQLLEQQLRRGDYHVASFTKPIPTSSYIHALPEGRKHTF